MAPIPKRRTRGELTPRAERLALGREATLARLRYSRFHSRDLRAGVTDGASCHASGMGPEATAALVGAGLGAVVGFTLGFFGDWIRETLRERRDAKAAARMIFAELQANGANLVTAHYTGRWPSPYRRAAWDAHGAKLARRKGSDVGRITFAYDVAAYFHSLYEHDEGAGVTAEQQKLMEQTLDHIWSALAELAQLSGESPETARLRAERSTEPPDDWLG